MPEYGFIHHIHRNALEAARQIGEINIQASEKLFIQQFAVGEAMLEVVMRNMDLATKVSTTRELLAGQVQLAQKHHHQLLDGFSRMTEVLNQASQGVNSVFEESFKAARDHLEPKT